MTQTPESPNDRIDRLETALGRFAELSFQSYRQHDEALSRLEVATERLTTTTERLVAEGAEQRQQAAIDRQEFRSEIREIWQYLRDRNGGINPNPN